MLDTLLGKFDISTSDVASTEALVLNVFVKNLLKAQFRDLY